FHTFGRAKDYLELPQLKIIRSLADQDWDLFTQTFAYAQFGWSENLASKWATIFRTPKFRETLQKRLGQAANFDVSPLLKDIATPTLVIKRKDFKQYDAEMCQTLVSEIPNAALVLMDGASGSPFTEDRSIVDIVSRFIEGRAEPVPGELHPSLTRREVE